MITYELRLNNHADLVVLEHYGYFNRFSNEYVTLGDLDGYISNPLYPASKMEELIKDAYEKYLEQEDEIGRLTEFD